ncbi:MAG TPA: type III pantothenate kinase [Acidimicrobiales bacterium]|nr:type III pantothenate kinase [Acidimicrobiales bacterium]
MLLAVDAGNTQTLFGLYPLELSKAVEPIEHWRIASQANRTADEYALMVRQLLALGGHDPDAEVHGIAIASSVPTVTAALREMGERHFDLAPVVIGPGVKSGMPILYDNPREVGPDRIADAVGAFDLYGGPTIVVDFGTATTFEAISAKGEYLGGAIVPGIEISLDALYARAAALRRVELTEPRQVIGKSTAESISSGAMYGFAAQVDGLVARIEAELGADCTVVATGGLSAVIAPLTSRIQHHEPWLTLHGTRIVYQRNTDTG